MKTIEYKGEEYIVLWAPIDKDKCQLCDLYYECCEINAKFNKIREHPEALKFRYDKPFKDLTAIDINVELAQEEHEYKIYEDYLDDEEDIGLTNIDEVEERSYPCYGLYCPEYLKSKFNYEFEQKYGPTENF